MLTFLCVCVHVCVCPMRYFFAFMHVCRVFQIYYEKKKIIVRLLISQRYTRCRVNGCSNKNQTEHKYTFIMCWRYCLSLPLATSSGDQTAPPNGYITIVTLPSPTQQCRLHQKFTPVVYNASYHPTKSRTHKPLPGDTPCVE